MPNRLTSHFLTLAVAASLVTAARADDWTSAKEVTVAAGSFADAAKALHKSIRVAAEDSPLDKEMDQIAKAAQKFHESVKMGATYEQSIKDHSTMGKSYEHFREALKKDHDVHHDEHVVADAKKLTAAHDQLQAHMEGRRETKPVPTPAPARP